MSSSHQFRSLTPKEIALLVLPLLFFLIGDRQGFKHFGSPASVQFVNGLLLIAVLPGVWYGMFRWSGKSLFFSNPGFFWLAAGMPVLCPYISTLRILAGSPIFSQTLWLFGLVIALMLSLLAYRVIHPPKSPPIGRDGPGYRSR